MEDIRSIRSNYGGMRLDTSTVKKDPTDQFKLWLEDAVKGKTEEPTAMTLATASGKGVPSVRTVLLKDFDVKGFTFYTNYDSRKGKEITENPNASLLFFWPALFRQVRIDGTLTKVDASISKDYFRSRPRESQISAWISPQSRKIESREYLEQKFKAFETELLGSEVPYPDFWGGYCLKPHAFEFWQGQQDRLHDRIEYCFDTSQREWLISRLAP